MNDKQQLAAMGEHMAEQPLCMAKRIEELESQVRVMADLLRDLHEHIGTSIPQTVSEHYRGCDLLERIDAALAGKMPSHVEQPLAMVPAPAVDAHPMQPILLDPDGCQRFKKNSAVEYLAEGRLNEIASRGYSAEDMTQLAQLIGYSVAGFGDLSYVSDEDYERAMLAAAPKPEAK